MPPSDADSDSRASLDNYADAEADADANANLATIDELTISDDQRQKAIDHVDYQRCARVRAMGERYQDHVSLRVLCGEFDMSMAEVRRALQTYHLVHAEPPVERVPSRAYDNGRRYFADTATLSELDADSRVEAKEHVQMFVGWTLLDNDVERVDISEPVPEIDRPMREMVQGNTDIIEQFSTTNFGVFSNFLDSFPYMSSTGALSAAINPGFSTSAVDNTFSDMYRIMRDDGLYGKMMPFGVRTSIAATSGLAGLEPSMFHASLPAIQGLMNAVTVMPDLHQLFDPMFTSGLQHLADAVQAAIHPQLTLQQTVLDDRVLQAAAELAAEAEANGVTPMVDPTTGPDGPVHPTDLGAKRINPHGQFAPVSQVMGQGGPSFGEQVGRYCQGRRSRPCW